MPRVDERRAGQRRWRGVSAGVGALARRPNRRMNVDIIHPSETVEARARLSLGASNDAIYQMVADALATRGVAGGRVVDVGCGGGALWKMLADRLDQYAGIDAVRYPGLPPATDFRQVDLDAAEWPVCAGEADVVTAVETIEHLENPWAFVRALVRIARPGGWGRGDDAESAQCAQPAHAAGQAPLLSIPG